VIARRWQVLIVTSAGAFMSFLDVTIANIAFPSIRGSFDHTSLAHLSWVLNAYNVVFAAALIPAGRLADRYGRRRFFFAGTVVFLTASVLCGAAWDADVLIVARALQALGGAALVPTSLSLVLPEFPLERRATATAIWGSTGAIAAATGPSLGGLLVDWQGWRWVFYVNLFIGIPALVAGRRILHESRDSTAQLPDLIGTAMVMLGVGALALALVEGPDWGWSSIRVIAAFASASALLVLTIIRSARHPRPAFELELFRVRSFSVATAGISVFAAGFYALLLSNVLFLTGVWHYSILRAGFALTPSPLMAALAGPVGGRLSDRYGQRVVAVPGGLLFAGGPLFFLLVTGSERHWATHFLPGMMLTGIGIGLCFSGFGSAVYAELPRQRYATGSALSTTCRQIGAVVGIAVLIAILGSSSNQMPTAFHHAWETMFATGSAAAITALGLGRVRARHVDLEREIAVAETELAGAPLR
jgi:EmrB/QacA subfamily drug resistance transporter